MAARTRTSSTTTTTTSYKPAIRYRGGTRYDVQSRTRPDHVHEVDTYRLTCTCEAGRWGKRCWAMATALQFEAWRKHELAKAAAPATSGVCTTLLARPSGPALAGRAALEDAVA